MIPSWALGIRSKVPRRAAIILGVFPIILLVFFWWLLTRGVVEERVIGPTILPSPREVVDSLRDLLSASDPENRTLFDHTCLSLSRDDLCDLPAREFAFPFG